MLEGRVGEGYVPIGVFHARPEKTYETKERLVWHIERTNLL